METYKLQKPINWDGKDIKELKFDFDSLTVDSLEQAEREARPFFLDPQEWVFRDTDKRMYASVTALACGLPIQAIRTLRPVDYLQVCLLGRDFLFGGDTEEIEPQKPNTQTTNPTPDVAKP